jgi:hypothetical protein
MFDANWLNLVLVPLKSVPKRKPNAKHRMDAVIINVILVGLAIDEYYDLNSALIVISKIIFFLIQFDPFLT